MDDSNEKSSISNIIPNNKKTIKSISLNLLNNDSYNLNDRIMVENNNINSFGEKLNEKIIKLLVGDHPLLSMKTIEKIAYCNFMNQYYNDQDFYNIKVIDEIIHNENSHIVAEFKDYLIRGDISEFLQKCYKKKESLNLLPKIYEYYISCSVIFPNYVILPESQYIYKNIQRKQRVIDIQQEQEDKEENIKNGLIEEEREPTVFNTQALDSILNQTDTSGVRQFFGISIDMSKVEETDMMKLLNNIEKSEKRINLNLNNSKKNNTNISKLKKGGNNIELFQNQNLRFLNEGGYTNKILSAFNKKSGNVLCENKKSRNNNDSNQNRNSLKLILRQNTENINIHKKKNNFSTQITYINSCNNNPKKFFDFRGIESIKKLNKNEKNQNGKKIEKAQEKKVSRQLYKNNSETFQSIKSKNSKEKYSKNIIKHNRNKKLQKYIYKDNSENCSISQSNNKYIKKQKNIHKEYFSRNNDNFHIDSDIKTYSKDPFKNTNKNKDTITSCKTKSQSKHKNRGFQTSRNKYDNKKMYLNVITNYMRSNISNNHHQSLDAESKNLKKKKVINQIQKKHNNVKNNLLNALLSSGYNNQRKKINKFKNILIQKDINDSLVDSIEIKNLKDNNNEKKFNKEKEYNEKNNKIFVPVSNEKNNTQSKRILSAYNLDSNNKFSNGSCNKAISINSYRVKHKNSGSNINTKIHKKHISMSKIPTSFPENKILNINDKNNLIIEVIDNKNKNKIKEFIDNYLDDYFSSKTNNNFNNTQSRNFRQEENNNNYFKTKSKSKSKIKNKNDALSYKNFHDKKFNKDDNVKIRNNIFYLEKGISKKISEKNFYLFDKFKSKISHKNKSNKKTSSVCSNKSGNIKSSGELLSSRELNSKYQMNAKMIELLSNKIQKIKQSIKEASDRGSNSISSILKKKKIPSTGRKSFIVTKKTEDIFEKKAKNASKTRNKKSNNGIIGAISSNSNMGINGNLVNSIINSIYNTNLLSPNKNKIEYEKLIKTFQKFKRPTNSFIGNNNNKSNSNKNNNYNNYINNDKKDSKRKKSHEKCNSIYGNNNNYENNFNIEVNIKNNLRTTSKKSLNDINNNPQNDNISSLNINFNNYTNNYNYNYNIESINNINSNWNKGNINFNNINYNNSNINKVKSSSQKIIEDKVMTKNEINFNGIPISGFEKIITKKYNNRNYDIPMSITDRIKKSNLYSTSIANNNINSTRYKNTNNRGYFQKK